MRLLPLDEGFHERLATLSGDGEFARAIQLADGRIRFVRWIDMRNRRSGTQGEHLAIVGHLLERDAVAAAALMRGRVHRRLDQVTEVIRAGHAEIRTGNALAVHVLGEA